MYQYYAQPYHPPGMHGMHTWVFLFVFTDLCKCRLFYNAVFTCTWYSGDKPFLTTLLSYERGLNLAVLMRVKMISATQVGDISCFVMYACVSLLKKWSIVKPPRPFHLSPSKNLWFKLSGSIKLWVYVIALHLLNNAACSESGYFTWKYLTCTGFACHVACHVTCQVSCHISVD